MEGIHPIPTVTAPSTTPVPSPPAAPARVPDRTRLRCRHGCPTPHACRWCCTEYLRSSKTCECRTLRTASGRLVEKGLWIEPEHPREDPRSGCRDRGVRDRLFDRNNQESLPSGGRQRRSAY